MNRIVYLIVFILSYISITPAFAASSSSASLSNLTYTLTDLDLNDAVTPSLTWDTKDFYDNYLVRTNSATNYNIINQNQPYFFDRDNLGYVLYSGSLSTSVSTANYYTDGSDFFSSSYMASGSAQNNSDYSSNVSRSMAFILSAKTMVSFSAIASNQLETTVGYDGFGYEGARAVSYISGDSLNISKDYIPNLPETYLAQSVSEVKNLNYIFSNVSLIDEDMYVHAGTYVFGYSTITPVPEPETYAMLLAGLSLVGIAARRRKISY